MNRLFSSDRARQGFPLALMFLGAAIAVCACLQALNYPFIADDRFYIVENAKLSGLHWSGLWRLFVEPFNEFTEFLPLREMSYWFDLSLFGPSPAAFRIHNIVLYVLC